MRRHLLTTSAAALCAAVLAVPATAQEQLTVMSWGGSYGNSQVQAFNIPFGEKMGVNVVMIDADNPAAPLRAMVEAGNVTVDVFDVEKSDAVRLCDEGLLEVLDHAALPPAPDGTPASEDFLEGTLSSECAVTNVFWSTIFAYRTDHFVDEAPTSVADLFDLERFPGRRGLRRNAKVNLEMALMADGVPPAEVYAMLATDEGVDRAFAKLDTIRDHVVWWEAGAQPPQLLADREVVMTTAYNGRIFNAEVTENQPFNIVWDGQILDVDLFVIPRGAPNAELAWEYIKFATDTQRLADQAQWCACGPARRSSVPLVGLFNDGVTEMGPHMPTAPENLVNALVNDFEFWADRDVELNERFNAWLVN